MSWDKVSGAVDRVLLVLCTWLVSRGYITSQTAADIATLALGFIGVAVSWWVNRPKALLQAASNTLPTNARLVLQTSVPSEKAEVQALADSVPSDKVVAKTGTTP